MRLLKADTEKTEAKLQSVRAAALQRLPSSYGMMKQLYTACLDLMALVWLRRFGRML
jgi:hypothetical protein